MYPKLFTENTLILEVTSIDLKMVTIRTLELTMRSVEGQAVGGLTLVMAVDQLFAVKNVTFETIAMMIIIWESRNIIVEKNTMRKTACCQETDMCMITTVDITAMTQILRDQKVTITHMGFLRKMIHRPVMIRKDLLGDDCYLQHQHQIDDLPLILNASADRVVKMIYHSLQISIIALLYHFT